MDMLLCPVTAYAMFPPGPVATFRQCNQSGRYVRSVHKISRWNLWKNNTGGCYSRGKYMTSQTELWVYEFYGLTHNVNVHVGAIYFRYMFLFTNWNETPALNLLLFN